MGKKRKEEKKEKKKGKEKKEEKISDSTHSCFFFVCLFFGICFPLLCSFLYAFSFLHKMCTDIIINMSVD